MHNSVTILSNPRHLDIEKQLKTKYHDNFKFTFTGTKQETSALCKLFKHQKNSME